MFALLCFSVLPHEMCNTFDPLEVRFFLLPSSNWGDWESGCRRCFRFRLLCLLSLHIVSIFKWRSKLFHFSACRAMCSLLWCLFFFFSAQNAHNRHLGAEPFTVFKLGSTCKHAKAYQVDENTKPDKTRRRTNLTRCIVQISMKTLTLTLVGRLEKVFFHYPPFMCSTNIARKRNSPLANWESHSRLWSKNPPMEGGRFPEERTNERTKRRQQTDEWVKWDFHLNSNTIASKLPFATFSALRGADALTACVGVIWHREGWIAIAWVWNM